MAYSDEVLADSPWLYWRLGEPSGSTAHATNRTRNDVLFDMVLHRGRSIVSGIVSAAVAYSEKYGNSEIA